MTKDVASKKAPSFEDALSRLEEIVSKLEAGEDGLEEAIALFEEGTKLSKLCQDRLAAAQGKIEKLVENNSGKLDTEPMV